MERSETVDWLRRFLDFAEPALEMLDLEGRKVLEKVRDLVDTPGDPERLQKAKEGWDQDFLGGYYSSSLTGKLDKAHLEVGLATSRILAYWEGDAADAFASYMRDRIQPAISVLEKHFKKVGDTLASAKQARDIYWDGLGTALTMSLGAGFVSGFVATMLSGGTTTAVAAIASAVGAFIVFVAEVIKNVLESDRKLDEALTELGSIRLVGFEKERWPRPSRSLRDGSVSDGDDSDWSTR